METKTLALLVRDMREKQQAYFKAVRRGDSPDEKRLYLTQSKEAEFNVDTAIKSILSNQETLDL